MKHQNKKLTSCTLALTILLVWSLIAGCSKMVDINLPHNRITVAATFINNDQANSVIASIYSQMMTNSGLRNFSNGTITQYAGLSADELESYQGVSNFTDYPYFSNKIIANTIVSANNIWAPAYKIIFDCNSAIDGILNSTSISLEQPVRRQLIGEAKFIRAFSYFYLVNLFGDIPMPLVADFNRTISLTRSPVDQVYAQIIKDLKEAQAALPLDYAINPNNERIRANKWAATALLARAYLYRKDWPNAEAEASSLIANPLFTLGTLDNIFLKNSSETILALKQNTTKPPHGATYDGNNFIPITLFSPAIPNYNNILTTLYTYISLVPTHFPTYNMTPLLVGAFETGDLRKTRWTQSWTSPVDPPYFSRRYYAPYKYKVRALNATPANTEYYILLRLSEQYLIRAEARAHLNNLSGAAADLLPIRSRAGLGIIPTNNQTQVLDAIAHERRIELFAEWGHRWLDLKRTGQAETVLSGIVDKQPWSNNQLLYPIPLNDIKNNPKLTQNPGYE